MTNMTGKIVRGASNLVLVFALASLPNSLPAAEKPNFTGTWRLNRKLSDDARQKIQEAMANSGGVPAAGEATPAAAISAVVIPKSECKKYLRPRRRS